MGKKERNNLNFAASHIYGMAQAMKEDIPSCSIDISVPAFNNGWSRMQHLGRFNTRLVRTEEVSSESYNNLVDCEHSVNLVKTESASSPVIGDEKYDRSRK
jgi:uncharacterized protein YegP (UPF0339 family)